MKPTTPIRLDDWAAVGNGARGRLHLEGRVRGDPRRTDGTPVTTSRVAAAAGRVVTTKTGTAYRLGRVSRKYRRWLRAQGIAYDRRAPVRVVGRKEAPC